MLLPWWGCWRCTPWGDKVYCYSWISHKAADCNILPQRLPSLFLHCLALPNYALTLMLITFASS